MPDSNVVLYPGELLLPADRSSLTEWACVACDQFTSQPRYWEDVRRFVGNHPSTLDLILPECYLNEAPQRIERIHRAMRDDLEKGVLVPAVSNGFILVERNTSSGARVGLVALLDLECYDPAKGSQIPGARLGGNHRRARASPHDRAARRSAGDQPCADADGRSHAQRDRAPVPEA